MYIHIAQLYTLVLDYHFNHRRSPPHSEVRTVPSFVAIAPCPTASLGSVIRIIQLSPQRASSSLLPSTMTTTSFQSAEAVADKDGLIHGVSAHELQILGEQCIEAKGKAYCTSC
jgi:hypothetical protein